MIIFEPTYNDLQKTPIGEWVTVITTRGPYLNIRGKDCMVSIQEEPTNLNRGTFHAIVEVFNPDQMQLDLHDGWTVRRYYFDLDRAKAEVEAWLKAWKQFDAVEGDRNG